MIEIQFSKTRVVGPEFGSAWDKVFKLKDAKFFELPSRRELWSASEKRATEIHATANTTCVIGIGGSSLGARALEHGFGASSAHRLVFAEAPDETSVARWRRSVSDPRKTHFVLISKSGKTIETLALLDFWSDVLKRDGLDLAGQSTVICGAGASPLRGWAENHRVPILPVPEDVGGRFSVLTPVGLVPAALLGVSLENLRQGAEWALGQRELVLQLSAEAMESFQEQRWITQMWAYSDAFQVMGLWWQQLWSESLGKRQNRTGGVAPRASTPMVCTGPQDQHSLLQQVQEGHKDKFVICLRDTDAEALGSEFAGSTIANMERSLSKARLGRILAAEAEGFLGALRESGVPHLVLRGASSKPETWGAFFMIWELVIAALGEVMDINAFDQPGVELGKRLAIQSLYQRL